MTIPAKMRAVQLVGHGGPEMLELREVVVPEVRRGEVLVRVAAAAVNNTDINTRIGWYSKGDNDAADASWTGTALPLPLIQGADVCGYIAAVGEGVEPDRVGERVLIEPSLTEIAGEQLETPWYFGSECDGGFAQYTRVASRHAHQVDSALSDVELASFPCSYSTAENMLTRAAVGRGDRVLVTGASGGVGSAAIQLAAARGALVSSRSRFASRSCSRNRSITPLVVAASIPTRRPRWFWLIRASSRSLASTANCVGVISGILRLKISRWRWFARRSLNPICCSNA